MNPARVSLLYILLIVLTGISPSPAFSEGQLRAVSEPVAGIRIGIPQEFAAEGKPTKWGRTWSAPDGAATINSLAFQPGRALQDIYAHLIALKGRVVTERSIDEDAFALAGRDSDGSGFYITARRDTNIVRGFSIIYPAARAGEYVDVIRRVGRSFELISSLAPFQHAVALRPTIDRIAGAKIGIPTTFPVDGTPTSWGHSWTSPDGNIVIKSLAFQKGRKIGDIFASLSDSHPKGVWTITAKSRLVGDSFAFETIANSDDTHFYLAARQEGDIVRGFSVEIRGTRTQKLDSSKIVEQLAGSLELVTSAGNAPSSAEAPRTETAVDAARCTEDAAELARLAQRVMVSISSAPDLRVGGRISVHWRSPSRFPTKLPVYLLFAMPEHMRIQALPQVQSAANAERQDVMKGYFALTANGRAPHDIAFGSGRARVLVPLHQPGSVSESGFDVSPLRAGQWPIQYALVAQTPCGERLLTTAEMRSYGVGSGSPKVVMQDPYSLDTPEKVIVSNSGTYLLRICPDRYRVIDADTGALIIERPGERPNFSPTSRYVSASVGTRDGRGSEEQEIIDLLSGELVAHPAAEVVGWANGDSFLVTGRADWGVAEVSQSLVSATRQGRDEILPVAEAPFDCHACRSWERVAFNIDLDNGVVVFSQVEGDNASLCEIGGTCIKEEGKTRLAGVLQTTYKAKWPDRRTSWGSIEYSSVPGSLPEFGVYQHQSSKEPKLASLAAQPRQQTLSAGDWRSGVRPRSAAPNEAYGTTFFEQLAQFDLAAADPAPYEVAWPTPEWKRAESKGSGLDYSTERALRATELARLRTVLAADIPEIASITDESSQFPYNGELGEGQKLNLDRFLEGAWRFGRANAPIWLLQLHTFEGSAGIGHGALFIIDSRRPVGERLVGGNKGPLYTNLSAAEIERRRLALRVIDDRYLIYASTADETIHVYDVELQKEVVHIPTGSHGNDLLKEVRLTRDLQHVIQINSDGQFFVYESATGGRVVSGCFIDDEIVLYSDKGYFWSSLEGANVVHVRFPGLAGLYTFNQFASQLEKPEIIKALLKGTKVDISAPKLSAPPQVSIEFLAQGQRKLIATASGTTPLKYLKVFSDGRPIKSIDVTGTNTRLEIVLDEFSGTRLLTVLAIDELGLSSQPQSMSFTSTFHTATNLFGLFIGVNKYANPDFTQLSGAVEDARTAEAAFKAASSKSYASVKTSLLLDDNASPFAIKAALAEIAAKAQPEDT
jgi:hypothetical protein